MIDYNSKIYKYVSDSDSDNLSDIDGGEELSDFDSDDDINYISNREQRRLDNIKHLEDFIKTNLYLDSNNEYKISYKCIVEGKPIIKQEEKIGMYDITHIGKINLPTDEKIIMSELTNVEGSGVYVCRLTNSKYYVGMSNNLKLRIKNHKSLTGGSVWTRSEKIISFLNPITPPQDDLHKWEQLETIARMMIHGTDKVRGGKYTSVNALSRYKKWKIKRCMQNIFGDNDIKIDEIKYLIKNDRICDKIIHNDGNIKMDDNVNIKKGICVINIKCFYFVRLCGDIPKFLNKIKKVYDKKNISYNVYYPITKHYKNEDYKVWHKREVLIRILMYGFRCVYGGCYRKYRASNELFDKIYDEICDLFA